MLIKNPLFICLGLYLLFVLFVNPRGEFPVNDDWFYVRQVGEFDRGVIKINSMIDSSFILQGILDEIWSKLFGLNFISLRVLTITLNSLTVYGLYLVLKYMNINKIFYLPSYLHIHLIP